MSFRYEGRGNCFTCAYFGHLEGRRYVWCEIPRNHHLVADPGTGCGFWMREPGADEGG
jgi:hypothetical protein